MYQQPPAHNLLPFISHYWMSCIDESAAHPILPDCCIDVVFEIRHTVGGRIYGAATHKSSCAISLDCRYLGICFLPGQFRHFLKHPAVHFTDNSMEIADLAGLKRELLVDDIGHESVFQVLDRALSNWLERQPVAMDWIDQALNTLDRRHGNIRIEALVTDLGLSRRQVERRFLDVVGVSPKTYARIRRWKRAQLLLRTQPALPLASVALDSGYADQSHMNRDFHRLIGESPKSFADAAFVQDSIFLPD
jgi:AraC-like DNA-binding protein